VRDDWWVDITTFGNESGKLSVLEQRNFPFNIKRLYYIHGVDPKQPRGFHAHKATHQMAICVNGSCDIFMDDGNNKVKLKLNSPEKGLLIEPWIWHEMHNFSADCVLLVLASDIYDESDYIRDYHEFRTLIKN
jgi:dTDP-4-dehydrorhamnose 3,5-epimerase-like enzyme